LSASLKFADLRFPPLMFEVIVQTLMVTPSGALSPGPLTEAAMTIGARHGWKGGLKTAIGHAAFEAPYIGAVSLGFNAVKNYLTGFLGDVITVIGVAALLFYAYTTIADAFRDRVLVETSRSANLSGSPVFVGFALTAFNVYFLLWWLSAGFPLISASLSYGLMGLAVMYLSHVWMDFAWLTIVAEVSRRGANIGGRIVYRTLLVVFGLLLAVFAVNILLKRFAGFGMF